jgi:hypothetical protein
MSMRRWRGLLVVAAGIAAATFLVAGCNAAKSAAGAIKSAAASHGVTISPPSRPTTQPAPPTSAAPVPEVTTPATSSPAASSGSNSALLWVLIALAAIVIIGLIIWLARASGRRSAAAARWQSQVVDAYAKGSALADAIRIAEAPGALVAAGAGARWSEIQRRMDDLGQVLYALQESAPDDGKRQRVTDALGWMQAVRATMTAERGPEGDSIPPERARSRLASFEAALQALRAPDQSPPL